MPEPTATPHNPYYTNPPATSAQDEVVQQVTKDVHVDESVRAPSTVSQVSSDERKLTFTEALNMTKTKKLCEVVGVSPYHLHNMKYNGDGMILRSRVIQSILYLCQEHNLSLEFMLGLSPQDRREEEANVE